MNTRLAGRLDPDFGEAGIAQFEVPSGYRGLTKVLPDNSFISIGSTDSGRSIAILKHHENGKRDEAFDLVILTLVQNQDFSLRDALVQDDGKVVIFGAAADGTVALFARLRGDGTLDPGFGDRGLTKFDIPEEFQIEDVRRRSSLVSRDDDTLVASVELRHKTSVQYHGVLFSLNGHGLPEASFGDLGAVYSYSEGLMSFQSLLAQADGKVLVTGQRERGGLVARYTREGNLDQKYDRFGKGYVLVDGTGGMHVELYAACQQGDRTLASGYLFKSEGYLVALIARLQPNGDLDPTFNGGKSLEGLERYQAWGIAVLDDQRILASLSPPISPQNALFMLDQAGIPDESFGSGGLLYLEFDSDVQQSGFQPLKDGKAMMCASSTSGNKGAIARVLLH